MTLAVAIVGLVLAVASLVWQAATFVLSGSRVKAALLVGTYRPDGLLTWKVEEVNNITPRPDALPVVVVQVTNSGRTDVDVVGWSLDFGEGASLHPAPIGASRPVPFRLQHGSQETLFLELARVYESAYAMYERPPSVGGVVRLGNGKTTMTRERLSMPPEDELQRLITSDSEGYDQD